MKKGTSVFLWTLGIGSVWCAYRNKKYPLAKGYGMMNKVIIGGAALNKNTAKLANKIITRIGLPDPPRGITRECINMDTRDDHQIPLSVYRSDDAEKNSRCLIYFHGGGFCLKDEAYIHKLICEYVSRVKCTIVFVHYRTADKYPFPIPFYDCCDAIQYMWENADSMGIEKKKFALGGDSAGGALTASCALWCREKEIPICFQMLVYPVTDRRMGTETSRKYKDAPMWNSSLSKKMWEIYLRNGIPEKEEYASPALAKDFSRLPPAFIEVCEFDSLRDEGIEYADALKNAGVSVEVSEIKGGFHGFDVFRHKALAKGAVEKRCRVLASAFNRLS